MQSSFLMKFAGVACKLLQSLKFNCKKDSCFETHSTFTRAGVFYAMMLAESLVNESTIREMR
jgi:hypothetical protein